MQQQELYLRLWVEFTVFFTHDIIDLNARTVTQIRVCVKILSLV